MDAGHVFVTRGDLTRLACDAWLLPTGPELELDPGWWTSLRAANPDVTPRLPARPPGWGRDARTLPAPDLVEPGRPAPLLVDVGGSLDTPVSFYLEGVAAFVAATAGRAQQTTARSRALLALPVVGTGGGGAAGRKGEILSELLPGLRALAVEHGVDLALVTRSASSYAAAQQARRDEHDAWRCLPDHLDHAAGRLAAHAADDDLVLFLGAGVSRSAGLPGWRELLERLAIRAGCGPDERAALHALPELDRGRLIRSRLEDAGLDLAGCVEEEVTTRRHALAHALLASLETREVVTTNYDTLFELAALGASAPVRVLPYEPVAGRRPWLLKLHGSVGRGDIVLTREDYLRYSERRAALAGIVQALLITRHLLFVGFSMTDENFHRIIDEVRRAVGPEHRRAFGTVLPVEDAPLHAELWRDELHFVPTGAGPSFTREGARRLEMLLDRLACLAARNTHHLLDDSFAAILTPDERVVRDALRRLDAEVPDEVRDGPAWRAVAQLLDDLGREAAGSDDPGG